MRLIALVGFILFFSTQAFTQGTLKGRITDSASTQPLGLATITVFKAADTAIITYRLSTPEGEFKVPGLPLNVQCRAVISFFRLPGVPEGIYAHGRAAAARLGLHRPSSRFQVARRGAGNGRAATRHRSARYHRVQRLGL